MTIFGADDAERTLVVLHGIGVDNRCAIGVHEPLFADRPGWRRLYPELPGMGRTVAPDWGGGTDDVFAVVHAIVDVAVAGRYAVSGGSYGGYLAAGLAAAQPQRIDGLSLLVPMVPPPGQRDTATHRLLYREPGVVVPGDSSVVVTAATVRRLAPRHKLVLGIPCYGQGWTGVTGGGNGLFQPAAGPAPATHAPGYEDYRQLKNLAREGFTVHRAP
ncbi:alpha/beta fold hydrolase [Micromonospora sp. LOL_024]|uniref:alpha/beta fold hydrolase n=1 Tax=Micromonospora sp. LOL_024 TaxID=3345412 RepID=UPI003A882266